MKDENQQEDLAVVSSAPILFVFACFILAYAHGSDPNEYGELENFGSFLFTLMLVGAWPLVVISLLLTLAGGVVTFKNKIIATAIGLFGSSIMPLSGFTQPNIVTAVLLLAVLVPAGSAMYIKMTATQTKTQE